MKEALNFIKWQISKWKWHDYLWFTGCGLVGAGFNNPKLMVAGVSIVFAMVLSYMVKMQWQKYKEERNKLFKTIKES